MTGTLFAAPRPVTASPSMSIYVPSSKTHAIHLAARVGDAVTVSGRKGPSEIKKMRRSGFTKPVLFDGMGYASDKPFDPDSWVQSQSAAGADRLLLPGAYLDWDATSIEPLDKVVQEQSALAAALGVGALIAVDARWLSKRYKELTDGLASMGCPLAVVPASARDPLASGRAVEGLRWLSARVHDLALLRSDHGAIGAVASGARHAAIGLNGSNRHFVPPRKSAYAKPSSSARVFIPSLVDWFLAEDMAAWSVVELNLVCGLVCCGGESIGRYFDDQLDATWHNMCALSAVADQILDAERVDQPREFIDICSTATMLYGLAGVSGPVEAKAQLKAWAFS